MLSHRVRSPDPAHEPAHLAIEQWTQDQMLVVGQQLKRKQFDLMDLQSLVRNPLERGEIFFFVKDRCTQVTAIQGMVKTACFVGTAWSWCGYFPMMKHPVPQQATRHQRGLTRMPRV